MLAESRPGLTDTACWILDVLKTHDDWMTRREIARALRQGSLFSYHLKLINMLNEQGLIEVERRPIRRGQGYQLVYRASRVQGVEYRE